MANIGTQRHSRAMVGLALCFASASLGCGSSAKVAASDAPKMGRATARAPVLPTGPLPRLSLTHWPWDGIWSTVEVFDDGDSRVLRVYRNTESQFLTTWKVQLTDSDAAAVDEAVKGLVSSAGTVHACPRPHGPEGALWISRGFAVKTDCVGDFRVDGGGPECARLEGNATKLMQLAKLQCGYSACLRPEELESGDFTCSLGAEGDDCRNPSSAHNAIPRRLLKGVRR